MSEQPIHLQDSVARYVFQNRPIFDNSVRLRTMSSQVCDVNTRPKSLHCPHVLQHHRGRGKHHSGDQSQIPCPESSSPKGYGMHELTLSSGSCPSHFSIGNLDRTVFTFWRKRVTKKAHEENGLLHAQRNARVRFPFAQTMLDNALYFPSNRKRRRLTSVSRLFRLPQDHNYPGSLRILDFVQTATNSINARQHVITSHRFIQKNCVFVPSRNVCMLMFIRNL